MTMKAPRVIVVIVGGKPIEERAHTFDSEGQALAVSMWLDKNGISHTRMNSTTMRKLIETRDAGGGHV